MISSNWVSKFNENTHNPSEFIWVAFLCGAPVSTFYLTFVLIEVEVDYLWGSMIHYMNLNDSKNKSSSLTNRFFHWLDFNDSWFKNNETNQYLTHWRYSSGIFNDESFIFFECAVNWSTL